MIHKSRIPDPAFASFALLPLENIAEIGGNIVSGVFPIVLFTVILEDHCRHDHRILRLIAIRIFLRMQHFLLEKIALLRDDGVRDRRIV